MSAIATVAPAAATAVAPSTAKAAAPAKAPKVVAPRTTKALRPLKVAASVKAKDLKVDDLTVKVVRTSNTGLRIDHTNCKHETSGSAGKKARAACRARVEKSLKK